MRDHKNVDDLLNDIKVKLKQSIPGYDFDTFNLQTIHDDQSCIDGDIFSHNKAWRVSEIDKVERKNKHTEKDVAEGKIREGEDEEEDEIADVDDHQDNEDPASFNEGDEGELDHDEGDKEEEHENEDEAMAGEDEGNEQEDKDFNEGDMDDSGTKEDL